MTWKTLLSVGALCWTASAQIQVIAPSTLRMELHNNGKIEGSTATFGTPDFGWTMQGKLFFAESQSTHCADDYILPGPDKDYESVQQNRIVVVRRGECSFVTKVSVAQDKYHAAAVIIVDKTIPNGGDTAAQLQNIIVADDGWGKSVRIPSILITNEDGEKLITATKVGDVQVTLSWDIPTNDIVVVDKWISLTNKDSLEFLSEFANWREYFGSQLSFKPHFMLGMSMFTPPADNHDQCLDHDGIYCFPDPDKAGKMTGAMVIKESIRMLCIHEITTEFKKNSVPAGNDPPQYSKAFWDFMYYFPEECPLADPQTGKWSDDPDHRFGEKCSKRLMEQVQMSNADIQKIDKCFKDNQPGMMYSCRDCGGIAVKNYWLDKMRNQVAWHDRALRINGWRYTGAYNVQGVVGAICKAYTHEPEACDHYRKGEAPPEPRIESGGMSFTTLLVACGIVIIVTAGGLLCYQRSLRAHLHSALREEVMLEVQSQMETYKQLPS
mmetsp:Transcript_9424/g.13312  ORF Transcript_9424/g.13312 Transcript_9424/m.13312 type:complete len:495 (-) Transcript_9424:41-1525(-)